MQTVITPWTGIPFIEGFSAEGSMTHFYNDPENTGLDGHAINLVPHLMNLLGDSIKFIFISLELHIGGVSYTKAEKGWNLPLPKVLKKPIAYVMNNGLDLNTDPPNNTITIGQVGLNCYAKLILTKN